MPQPGQHVRQHTWTPRSALLAVRESSAAFRTRFLEAKQVIRVSFHASKTGKVSSMPWRGGGKEDMPCHA